MDLLNGINPINWQSVAIKTTNKAKQIISGKWKIYGNIHFEENIDGSEFLNGVNVTEISFALSKEHPEIDDIIGETHVRKLFSKDIWQNIIFDIKCVFIR